MKKIIKKCSTCKNEFRTKTSVQCNACLDKQYNNMFVHAGIYTQQEIEKNSYNGVSLWQKAKVTVQKAKEAELKTEIREEYNKLKFESEKINANEEVLAEIKKLYDKMCKISTTGMGHNYILRHNRELLKEMIERKKYHPKELEELRRFVKSGIQEMKL